MISNWSVSFKVLEWSLPDTGRKNKEDSMQLYNTHFFWTPLLVGLFLSLEEKIAQGVAPAEMLDNVKTTTAFTLSAIGDTFFSASLMGLWGLSAACLVAGGHFEILAVLAAMEGGQRQFIHQIKVTGGPTCFARKICLGTPRERLASSLGQPEEREDSNWRYSDMRHRSPQK